MTTNTLTVIAVAKYVEAHWYMIGVHAALVAQFIGSWLTSSLDMPTATDGRWYRFWFKTANYFAGNKARAQAVPDPPVIK